MEDEKVTVDETLVLRFEDSTQPSKRIKQEPTDPDAKESKVIVDAMTQTEAFDADLKVEIATQTDRPLIYSCKCCYRRFRSSEKFVSLKMNFLSFILYRIPSPFLCFFSSPRKKNLPKSHFFHRDEKKCIFLPYSEKKMDFSSL